MITLNKNTDSLGDASQSQRLSRRSGVLQSTGQAEKCGSTCSHCQLPVPKGLIVDGAPNQFCCRGCRTAFEIINECDLTEFYRLAENQQSIDLRGQTYEHFDSEHFLEQHTTPFNSGKESQPQLRTVRFAIEGLHCNACIWLIEKLPRICGSVVTATVNWSSKSVTIIFDSQAKLSAIAQTLAKLGYLPSVYQPDTSSESSQRENRNQLFRLGFAGAAAGNNMLVALAIYLGQYSGINPAIERLLVFYSGIISLLSILGPGRQILKRAYWSMRTGTPHMDLPVGIGITVGAVSGWINLIANSSTVYFDSISILIFVLLLGRYFQQLQQRRAIDRISLVKQMIPLFCQRIGPAGVEQVSVEQIAKGDLVQVNSQEKIPVDGQIDHGVSRIDLAVLTGESRPHKVVLGDDVYAGSTNLGQSIVIKAAGPGSQSRIAEVFSEVEKSIRTKSKIVQFADRVGAKFVLGILSLAAITFLIWLPDYTFALNAAVAVLIVACPCALALATPLAISVALHGALRRKLFIKDGDAFELLAKCKSIWFDKTGTLTKGNLQVTAWDGDRSIQSLVYQIESLCGHATAAAIVRSFEESDEFAAEQTISLSRDCVQEFSEGVKAELAGQTILIGTKNFLRQFDIELTNRQTETESEYLAHGWSPVFVGVESDGVKSDCVAMLAIGDQVDPDSESVIKELQENYQVGILSGDRNEIVQQIALRLGVDSNRSFGELLPHEKTKFVEQSGKSLMIGDGVNDCSALAAASVGIAICDKFDVNSKIASIVMKRDQLQQVPQLLAASRRVMSLIYRNIGISISYNVLAVSLAMAGYIHPVIAALFMPISSITILLSSLACDPFPKKEGI